MSSQFKYILYEEKNQSAVITINREAVYNALNAEAKLEIVSGIREANKSQTVKSIILTGAGKAFCTGQDLNDRSVQADHGGVDLGMTLMTEWNPLINAIRDSKKIIIGAINGVCAGAGVSVAVACDLLVTKSDVKFMGAFSKLGLAPDAGSTYIFSRALGYQKTMEFFLLSNPLTGLDLKECGLVNLLSENVFEEAILLSAKINKLAPLSTSMIKNNIKAAMDSSFQTSMERETYAQRFLGNSADYKEGLNAFLAKREPNFNGH